MAFVLVIRTVSTFINLFQQLLLYSLLKFDRNYTYAQMFMIIMLLNCTLKKRAHYTFICLCQFTVSFSARKDI